jgi:hypothetical protein
MSLHFVAPERAERLTKRQETRQTVDGIRCEAEVSTLYSDRKSAIESELTASSCRRVSEVFALDQALDVPKRAVR